MSVWQVQNLKPWLWCLSQLHMTFWRKGNIWFGCSDTGSLCMTLSSWYNLVASNWKCLRTERWLLRNNSLLRLVLIILSFWRERKNQKENISRSRCQHCKIQITVWRCWEIVITDGTMEMTITAQKMCSNQQLEEDQCPSHSHINISTVSMDLYRPFLRNLCWQWKTKQKGIGEEGTQIL